MKTSELKIEKRTFVSVCMYAGSYGFAEPMLFAVTSLNALIQLTADFKNEFLPKSKAGSTTEAQKDTFWATFSISETQDGKYEEVFDLRVSI